MLLLLKIRQQSKGPDPDPIDSRLFEFLFSLLLTYSPFFVLDRTESVALTTKTAQGREDSTGSGVELDKPREED